MPTLSQHMMLIAHFALKWDAEPLDAQHEPDPYPMASAKIVWRPLAETVGVFTLGGLAPPRQAPETNPSP